MEKFVCDVCGYFYGYKKTVEYLIYSFTFILFFLICNKKL